MSRPNSQVYNLSQDQQDLLMAALSSNSSSGQPAGKAAKISKTSPRQNSDATKGDKANKKQDLYQEESFNGSGLFDSPNPVAPGSSQLDFDGVPDDSPFLDYDPDADDQFDFDLNGQSLIGDLPDHEEHDLHEKRKDIDGKDDDEEGGGKRRESEDKAAKKPGRKPLMNEPTSKRKAQNRAAQRAFRERKEKHLKDLETKVEDLEKTSESTTHENGLLKAQVERLQVELREYRKRLSWVSNGTGLGRSPPLRGTGSGSNAQNGINGLNNNDFQFDFPKFGDLPNNHMLARKSSDHSVPRPPARASTASSSSINNNSGTVGRTSMSRPSPPSQGTGYGPTTTSPVNNSHPASPETTNNKIGSVDSLNDLFSPSILAASRGANYNYFPQQHSLASQQSSYTKSTDTTLQSQRGVYSTNSTASNSDSPNSSADSQQQGSSIGTSPEPSLSSPNTKLNELGLNTISEEGTQSQQQAFQDYGGLTSGFANGSTGLTPGNEYSSFNWMAQQNNNAFDPVLFGDYREPQDAVIGQDFGTFFNEAFPLPDLGSPFNNLDNTMNNTTGQIVDSPETQLQQQVPAKVDLMKQVDAVQNGEEIYPGEDRSKMMTCNKIWDRLQSMDKFRNGEIDVDNLCSELRAKARCSEGGAVVDKNDVDKILNTA